MNAALVWSSCVICHWRCCWYKEKTYSDFVWRRLCSFLHISEKSDEKHIPVWKSVLSFFKFLSWEYFYMIFWIIIYGMRIHTQVYEKKLSNFYVKCPSHCHVLEWSIIFYMPANLKMISQELCIQLERKTLIELHGRHTLTVNYCCKVIPHLRGSV